MSFDTDRITGDGNLVPTREYQNPEILSVQFSQIRLFSHSQLYFQIIENRRESVNVRGIA